MALSIGTAWAAGSDEESKAADQTDSQTTATTESADTASTTDTTDTTAVKAEEPVAEEPAAPAEVPAAPAADKPAAAEQAAPAAEPEAPAAEKPAAAPAAKAAAPAAKKAVAPEAKAPAAKPDGNVKIEICHSKAHEGAAAGEGNYKKPYTQNSVAKDSIYPVGHADHKGGIFSMDATNWGDIIPPFQYVDKDGAVQKFEGLNWTTEGQAIYNNGCKVPGAPELPDAVPAAPAHTDAVCNAETGQLSAPTLTLTAVDGITYKYDEAKVVNGGEVTITATADDDHVLKAGNGWVLSEDGDSATITVTFENVPCETTPPVVPEATPAAPAVTPGECNPETGVATDPTLKFDDVEGVKSYDWNKNDVKNGGEVTVTATAEDGYKLVAGNGWTVNEEGTNATITVTFENVPCETTPPVTPNEVTPINPTVHDSVCVNDEATVPSLTFGDNTDEIDYTVKGDVKAGGDVTVVATPKGDNVIGATEGWTIHDDGTATFPVTFAAAADCDTTTPPTTEPPTDKGNNDKPKTDEPVAEGNLPRTGVDNGLWMLLIGGGALIAAGAATVIASRKKA